MVNILLEGNRIGDKWLYDELKNYIKPHHKVAVVALSFRSYEASNAKEWQDLYGKNGKYYHGITSGLMSYGISEDNISFLNYFQDTREQMISKIKCADILYFLGGRPDSMMERIEEIGLTDAMKSHDGIIMGYSAGAVIQLKQYHLSRDHEYPTFAYYHGLGYIDGFYLEVHYEATPDQEDAIKTLLSEQDCPIYASYLMDGALIVENGAVKPIGKVEIFKN